MILNEISRDDEQQSFISITDKGETLQTQTNLKQQIKMLPPIYLSMSLIVLSAAILSQFQYARAQIFPLFLELPFQKNQLFTIGNALISLMGIIIYYLVYQANQSKPIRKRYSTRQIPHKVFSFQIFLSGVLSHLAFLAFALLPIEYKNQSNFLYTEDRILLTFSFIMNFLFTSYYMCYTQQHQFSDYLIYINYFYKRKILQYFQQDFNLIVQVGFLTIQTQKSIISIFFELTNKSSFVYIISVNFISIFMGMPMVQGEPSLNDGLSASEDFIANMVSEIYSTLSYSLYLMNSFFIGMFYSDLQKINLIMSVDQEMMLNRNEKSK